MTMDSRSTARQLAHSSLARGDATGWFEELYAGSAGNHSAVPWADMRPNPNFLEWLDRQKLNGTGKSALVVGCGLGDDAEELAKLDFQVVAFDIAPTAIDWCNNRFPASLVQYEVGDLLADADRWSRRFDFVFEAYTLQALPPALRQQAISAIAGSVSANGTLLVIARGREPSDDAGSMPWPLTKQEVNSFTDFGLQLLAFEDYVEQEETPVRRFRAEFRRA